MRREGFLFLPLLLLLMGCVVLMGSIAAQHRSTHSIHRAAKYS
jgi:hypothetical protein